MPITADQRQKIIDLVSQGVSKRDIAMRLGLTLPQVAAVSAHITMGRYIPASSISDFTTHHAQPRDNPGQTGVSARLDNSAPVILGTDLSTQDEVSWLPTATDTLPNPHVLVIGQSGSGKTYFVCCLVAELASRGVPSIIFDYGQGFSAGGAPERLSSLTNPIRISATTQGISLNPLTIFSSDVLGPINVAQRIADTFSRVYKRIGIQQHAIIREAILEVFHESGFDTNNRSTWKHPLPSFSAIHAKLRQYSSDRQRQNRSIAATVESHVATLFIFNTFRDAGIELNWEQLLLKERKVLILQLNGLERSLEHLVTEFLLWNLIGYIGSLGPGSLRCNVVLDEAHKLSFGPASPVETLLREGRKFGLALILASQQPQDFDAVAFGNTATQIIFNISGDSTTLIRRISGKFSPVQIEQLARTLATLKRGQALLLSSTGSRVIRIHSMDERLSLASFPINNSNP